MSMEDNNKICEGCKWNGVECCTCPELMPGIWAYLGGEANVNTLSQGLAVCTQERVQNKTATAYLCPILANANQYCRHYKPQDCEK